MKDWLRIFLPIWAVGSVVWMVAGFVLLPNSYRKPVFYSANGVWTTSGYDPTNIDYEVARSLAIVIGPPLLAIAVAMAIVFYETMWGRRRSPEA